MKTPLHLRGRDTLNSGVIKPLDAMVGVPTSKSVANRMLVCALLAEGESIIHQLPDGDDVEAMRAALEQGGRLRESNDLGPASVRVVGGLSHGALLPGVVNSRLAGTTSRFLTAVAALQATPVVVTGDEPLRRRPMAPLHNALRELGATLSHGEREGHLPVTISRGVGLRRRVRIDSSMSSQFISALMMIGPCVGDGLTLEVTGVMVSGSYIEMTADCMRVFGADVQFVGNEIRIGASPYIPTEVAIEPDFSSAAFPVAAVLMAGGRVRIKDLADARLQGDREILDIAKKMGAVVGVDGRDVVVVAESGVPRATIDRDMSNCSDLVPAVAIACSSCDGVSRLRNIGFIRGKESDRLADLAQELSKFGCRISVDGDDLVIEGSKVLHSARIDPHHDHRLAMACALACVRGVDVLIDDPDVVAKSWPGYFSDMSEILRGGGAEN